MCSFRHTWPALPQDAGQRRLAHLDRLPPKVRAVQLQQVKGAKEGRRLVPAMAKHLEGSHALLIAAHNLAVDQTGPHLAPDWPCPWRTTWFTASSTSG